MDKHLSRMQKDRLKQVIKLADQQSLKVYIVGGIVRDLLLGRDNLDMDLVVEGNGISFAKKLSKILNAHLVTHETFGTSVLTFSDALHFDVAMARTETYPKPAALPVVKAGCIEEDLGRRDFSINSMAILLNGPEALTLLDIHNGQKDLRDKKVRVLHDKSFVDDPTRLFRAIRFEQRFGFSLEDQTASLFKQAVRQNRIAKLSGHRLFNEITAQLEESNPIPGILRLRELGLFKGIHPEWLKKSADLKAFDQVAPVLSTKKLSPLVENIEPWRMYLLVLFYGLQYDVLKKVMRRLDFGKRFESQVQGDIRQCREVLNALSRKKNPLPSVLYDLLSPCSLECLLLVMVVSGKERVQQWILLFLTRYQKVAQISLTGEDLIAEGIKPGPVFQQVFEVLRRARLDGEIHSRKEEVALVRRKFMK